MIILEQQNLALTQEASTARAYRDELDIANEKVSKLNHLERKYSKLQKKLADLDFWKQNSNYLTGENGKLGRVKEQLENEVSALKKKCEGLKVLEGEVVRYEKEINEMIDARQLDKEMIRELSEEKARLDLENKSFINNMTNKSFMSESFEYSECQNLTLFDQLTRSNFEENHRDDDTNTSTGKVELNESFATLRDVKLPSGVDDDGFELVDKGRALTIEKKNSINYVEREKFVDWGDSDNECVKGEKIKKEKQKQETNVDGNQSKLSDTVGNLTVEIRKLKDFIKLKDASIVLLKIKIDEKSSECEQLLKEIEDIRGFYRREINQLKEKSLPTNVDVERLKFDFEITKLRFASNREKVERLEKGREQMSLELKTYNDKVTVLIIDNNRLAVQHEASVRVCEKVEEENVKLLDQLKDTLSQNQDLLIMVLTTRDHHAEEEKIYIEQLSDLRHSKEKLEDKIFEQLRKKEKKALGIGTIVRKMTNKNKPTKSEQFLKSLESPNRSGETIPLDQFLDECEKSPQSRRRYLEDNKILLSRRFKEFSALAEHTSTPSTLPPPKAPRTFADVMPKSSFTQILKDNLTANKRLFRSELNVSRFDDRLNENAGKERMKGFSRKHKLGFADEKEDKFVSTGQISYISEEHIEEDDSNLTKSSDSTKSDMRHEHGSKDRQTERGQNFRVEERSENIETVDSSNDYHNRKDESILKVSTDITASVTNQMDTRDTNKNHLYSGNDVISAATAVAAITTTTATTTATAAGDNDEDDDDSTISYKSGDNQGNVKSVDLQEISPLTRFKTSSDLRTGERVMRKNMSDEDGSSDDDDDVSENGYNHKPNNNTGRIRGNNNNNVNNNNISNDNTNKPDFSKQNVTQAQSGDDDDTSKNVVVVVEGEEEKEEGREVSGEASYAKYSRSTSVPEAVVLSEKESSDQFKVETKQTTNFAKKDRAASEWDLKFKPPKMKYPHFKFPTFKKSSVQSAFSAAGHKIVEEMTHLKKRMSSKESKKLKSTASKTSGSPVGLQDEFRISEKGRISLTKTNHDEPKWQAPDESGGSSMYPTLPRAVKSKPHKRSDDIEEALNLEKLKFLSPTKVLKKPADSHDIKQSEGHCKREEIKMKDDNSVAQVQQDQPATLTFYNLAERRPPRVVSEASHSSQKNDDGGKVHAVKEDTKVGNVKVAENIEAKKVVKSKEQISPELAIKTRAPSPPQYHSSDTPLKLSIKSLSSTSSSSSNTKKPSAVAFPTKAENPSSSSSSSSPDPPYRKSRVCI